MIPCYEARTLGGMNDYSLEREDDGPLCRAYDVEKLEERLRRTEKREAALRDVMKAQASQLVMYRTGNFGRGGAVLAKLEKARKALRDAEVAHE